MCYMYKSREYYRRYLWETFKINKQLEIFVGGKYQVVFISPVPSDNFSLFLHLISPTPILPTFFALGTLLSAILYHFCLIIKFLHSKYPPCTGCAYRVMKFGLSK